MQTLLNVSNKSTLVSAKVNEWIVLDYKNWSLPIWTDNLWDYFSSMKDNLIDKSDQIIIFRRNIDWNDYDYFINNFKKNINWNFDKKQWMSCFWIFKKNYRNTEELNNLVKCSEYNKFVIKNASNWVYSIDMVYEGKVDHLILTFEYLNEENVY
jgi:hypothetical protein